MNNKFVFVIPYFNCQEDITRTIYSMVSQSYDDWRAVLINDLSTDGTRDVVHKACNSLPNHLRNKFTLVDNEEKHGEVRNTLRTVQTIDDSDVRIFQ